MTEADLWALAPPVTGWGAFLALAIYIVRSVLAGKLRPGSVVDADIARAEKQRDDAIDVGREAQAVNRMYAETLRDMGPTVERMADNDDEMLRLIRSALPAPRSES